MEQLHLLVMVAHFVWNALSAYAATPEGMTDLADIEAIVNAMEHPANQQPTQPGGQTSASTGNPQIIRK